MKQFEFKRLRDLGREVVQLIQKDGPKSGAELGNYLKRRHDFRPSDFGLPSLTAFLRRWAPELAIVGRSGVDVMWDHPDRITTEEKSGVALELDFDAPTPKDYRKLRARLDDDELEQLIGEALQDTARRGNPLEYAEWVMLKAKTNKSALTPEQVFVQVLTSWASPPGMVHSARDLPALINTFPEYTAENLAAALAAVALRFEGERREVPQAAVDIAYRLRLTLADLFELNDTRPEALYKGAAAELRSRRAALKQAVATFIKTTPSNAKPASIQVHKRARSLVGVSLAAEAPLLEQIEILLGAAFRKFCEVAERRNALEVLDRAKSARDNPRRVLLQADQLEASWLWSDVVAPIAHHITALVDEAVEDTREVTAPRLGLSAPLFKLDLAKLGQEVGVMGRLVNEGRGRAVGVRLEPIDSESPVKVRLVEPRHPFDVGGESEYLVKLGITVDEACGEITVPLRWHCQTIAGAEVTQEETIELKQQESEPDWIRLETDPPYTLSPIKDESKLFGRQAVLSRLTLSAAASNSCFLWGQKRIGKTSVLQVLAGRLRQRPDYICVLLRMGELKGLHEGQLANRLASRIVEEGGLKQDVPSEGSFGATLAPLVPFMDRLTRQNPDRKIVIIIDEFDDLDRSYYTGQRGAEFVKALRSLSEIGLTFFLVGSERMASIYQMHAIELNKWRNIYLDTIESIEDCRSLITRPVDGNIEYAPDAVDAISEYCGRNPFYVHSLCYNIFESCMSERRTYVSYTDFIGAQEGYLDSAGETSFAHFWDDNPSLSVDEKERNRALCCLALTCISQRGDFASAQELEEEQGTLELRTGERCSIGELEEVVALLTRRRILVDVDGRRMVALPILQAWLARNAQHILIPKWKAYIGGAAETETERDGGSYSDIAARAYADSVFPIAEDDLITVAQPLVFNGKQKDPTEIKAWLRQFDDDIRIEVAFALLERLSEQGYVSQGAYGFSLGRVEEAVREQRRNLGNGIWQEMRGKKDNLCISYVDSELKSGATVARELGKRLRPGKVASWRNIDAWLQRQVDNDGMLLFVDDFAGSGETLAKGLAKVLDDAIVGPLIRPFVEEGRVFVNVMYSFAAASERLTEGYPEIGWFFGNTFDAAVEALNEDAGIFVDDSERRFARDMLLQMGRDLVRNHPFGWNDIGGLVVFYNTIPNNTLPIFWSSGEVGGRRWKPLFPRA